MSKAHGKNDMKLVAKLVVEVATNIVEEKVPPCFSELARLLDLARSNQCFDIVASSVSESDMPFLSDITEKVVGAIRNQFLFSILDTIGNMRFSCQKEGSTIMPEPYLPKHVARVVKDLLAHFCVADKGVAYYNKPPHFLDEVIASPIGTTGMLWSQAMGAFMSELYDCHSYIELHKGDGYASEIADLLGKLKRMKANAMQELVQAKHLKIKVAITRNIELFPSERLAVIEAIRESFEDMHKEQAEAAMIFNNTLDVACKRTVEKHGRRAMPSASSGQQDAGLATPAADAVGSKTIDTKALVHDWAALTDGEEPDMIALHKAIVAHANYELSKIMLATVDGYSSNSCHANGIGIKLVKADTEDKGDRRQLKAKCEVHRLMLANKAERKDVKLVKLPYWGTIIDEAAAITMTRSMCLPLGDNKGRGPKLFVEGNSANNYRRSDACIAWAIPPLSAKAMAATKSTVATAQSEPLAKKPRKEKVIMKPTHIVDWMDLHFEVGGTMYEYAVPFLKDNPEHKDVFGEKCNRRPQDDRGRGGNSKD